MDSTGLDGGWRDFVPTLRHMGFSLVRETFQEIYSLPLVVQKDFGARVCAPAMGRKGRSPCKQGKNDRNATPEELESSIFATGKRRLTIRPRSKALLAMQWQEDGFAHANFTRPTCPKVTKFFAK
jgi:hypothetical protein